ncbi:MAG: hypothetical protein L6Q29_00880 [Candidatus Pacebacteria bacterium]|nr:hypothetical protein [Candidatus Paceibacterota bacterium]NUQ57162.1 hypothetical protein [Candidatus Paceibacter sp.]
MRDIFDYFPFFKLRDPRFLNLEYLYNQILELLKKLWAFLLYLLKLLALLFVKFFFFAITIIILALIALVIYKLYILKRRKKIAGLARFAEEDKFFKDRSEKWSNIKKKAESDEIEDRKAAIVEADNILDGILRSIGYRGDGLADKLKSIEPSDFVSLQDVWDAYKVRSKIAREGEKFELTKEEAKAALGKYEKGLKELGYV